MEIANEEYFGPILILRRAENGNFSSPEAEAEAILKMANAPNFGLGSSVFGRDSDPVLKAIVHGFKAGIIVVNNFATYYAAQKPFGGIEGSGYGRFAGEEGLRGVCNVMSICEDRFRWLGIRTGIPPAIRYPVRSQHRSWQFAKGVVELGYGISTARKGKWLLEIIKNS